MSGVVSIGLRSILLALACLAAPAFAQTTGGPFSVHLSNPRKGITWSGGGSAQIGWWANRPLAALSFQLSTDGGSTFRPLPARPHLRPTGTVLVAVPATATSNAVVRVTATEKGGDRAEAESDVFSIWVARRPPETLIGPARGATLRTGTKLSLRWNVSGKIRSQTVEYSPNALTNVFTLATLDRSARTYNMSAPAPTAAGAIFRIKLVDDEGIPRFIVGNVFTITP